jgi:hypothetical protein
LISKDLQYNFSADSKSSRALATAPKNVF